MNVGIISIGDELLYGQTINTNASWLGEQLSMRGFIIDEVYTIPDSEEIIRLTVEQTVGVHSLILITGGLGPTKDDKTKKVLADMFQSPLQLHKPALEAIERITRQRKNAMNLNNQMQAMLPVDATLIPNDCGTAWGMWFEQNGSIIISMPGVPFEMKYMMEHYVFSKLTDSFNLQPIIHRHILCSGIAESQLAYTIESWEDNLPQELKLAYLPSPGIVKLRITAIGLSASKATQLIAQHEKELLQIIGDYVFGFDDDSLEELVGKKLLQHSLTISTAESFTGGAIAQAITKISGSSQYFMGSVVAYHNTLKTNLLSVPESLIAQHGAVSKEVALSMAEQALVQCNSDCAIATTGIAGPTGGSDEKPVGMAWIAIAYKNKSYTQAYSFGNDRERTVTKATIAAMFLFLKHIEYML